MKNLKSENVKECFYLLREFIEEAQVQTDQKGIAMLALNHLQNIMAGQGDPLMSCNDIPRFDGMP